MPNIDDTNSAITYSGGWLVDGNLHSTTSVGSTATIRFTGTDINAYFTNTIGIGEIQATFTLDGRDFTMPPRHMHYISYPNDDFFLSKRDYGTLSQGTHTLVVQNTGSQGPLSLDYFVIDGSIERPAVQPPPPQTTQNQGGAQPSTTVVTRVQTVTNTQTATTTSTSTSSSLTTSSTGLSMSTSTTATSITDTTSSTRASVLREALSLDPQSGQTVTKFQVVTTSYSGVGAEVTLYSDGNGGFNVGATGKTIAVGVIVGAVVGSVAFVLLLILLIVLCLRRRRRAATVLSQSGQDGEDAGGLRESNTQGVTLSAFELPSRISQSIGAGHGMSKLRGQGHNRGFSRLEEGPETTDVFNSGLASPHLSLTINLYPNEKDTSLLDGFAAYGRSGAPSDPNTSTPPPLVSEGHAFSDTTSHYDVPPPAYQSGRGSHLYSSNAFRA